VPRSQKTTPLATTSSFAGTLNPETDMPLDREDLIVEMIRNNRTDSERRLQSIEEKMDEMLAFRWKTVGGSLAISALFAFAFNVLHTFIK
jgi:hypothetical protein